MSEAKKNDFAKKINAIKGTAPLSENKKEAEKKEVRPRGQPKKEEHEKQNIAITIHVNKKGLQHIENKAIDAGYSPKDKAKWLKNFALSNENQEAEIKNLKKELQKLKKELEDKEKIIKKITDKLIDKI